MMVIGLIIGLVIGSCFGVFVSSLCFIARREDERSYKYDSK